jgi:phosphohistidine phosphatase
MNTLYLLRHAKSSWTDDQLADHDRPLSKRGRRAADAVAQHLSLKHVAVDLVLSSTAARARETLEPILARLKPPRVLFDRDLYLAPVAALLERLREIDETDSSVLLAGHNPGLHELTLALADPDSPVAPPPLSGKFPTGALASFRFAGPWRRLKLGTATLVDFVTPRDLSGDKD